MIGSMYVKDGYVIKRPAVTNTNGIATRTLSTVATISGIMRPLNGREVLTNEKKGFTTTDRFYCEANSTNKAITEKDIIYESASGKYYEVVFPKNPMQMDHHLEIDCEYKKDLQENY